VSTVSDATLADTTKDVLHPGEWLPSNIAHLSHWLSALEQQACGNQKGGVELHPVLARFKAAIENDPEIFMLFHMMFDQ